MLRHFRAESGQSLDTATPPSLYGNEGCVYTPVSTRHEPEIDNPELNNIELDTAIEAAQALGVPVSQYLNNIIKERRRMDFG